MAPKKEQQHAVVTLLVRSEPPVTDPREMKTILTTSLRSLFGDLEPHSCLVEVSVKKSVDDDKTPLMRIQCPSDSVRETRAALTLVTPPPYLLTNQYRFDVIKIEEI